MRLHLMVPLLVIGGLLACGTPSGEPTVVIQAKGSDTMVNLMQLLSEEYTRVKPNVVVAVTGGGSGTGIKALIDGTTDLAASSRPMKGEEKAPIEAKGGSVHETVLAYD